MTQTRYGQQPAQDLFILCRCSGLRDIEALLNRIQTQLDAANIASVVLSYGMTPVPHRTSFIVIELYQRCPETILDSIRKDPEVHDFVLYNAPSLYEEVLADREIQQRQNDQQAAQASTYRPQPVVEPPVLPFFYTALSACIPLLGWHDERWVTRVFGYAGEGMLIYEERSEVLYLTADEAIALLSVLLEEASSLVKHVTFPVLTERHRLQIEAIRQAQQADEEAQG